MGIEGFALSMVTRCIFNKLKGEGGGMTELSPAARYYACHRRDGASLCAFFCWLDKVRSHWPAAAAPVENPYCSCKLTAFFLCWLDKARR